MDSIRTYKNLFKNFILTYFLLLQDYEQGALWKELIASLIERFKTDIWEILTDKLTAIYLKISFLLFFC